MSVMRRLQTAVRTRWMATPAVTGLIGTRMFNGQAPKDAAFPYSRLGEKTEAEAPEVTTFERKGWSDTLTVDAFTATHLTEDPPVIGDDQAWEIVEALSAAVEEPITVEGYGTVSLRQEFATVLVEPNEVRHAVVRYRGTLVEE